jgi:hypothetical protein
MPRVWHQGAFQRWNRWDLFSLIGSCFKYHKYANRIVERGRSTLNSAAIYRNSDRRCFVHTENYFWCRHARKIES